jgi:hypothetical protein
LQEMSYIPSKLILFPQDEIHCIEIFVFPFNKDSLLPTF